MIRILINIIRIIVILAGFISFSVTIIKLNFENEYHVCECVCANVLYLFGFVMLAATMVVLKVIALTIVDFWVAFHPYNYSSANITVSPPTFWSFAFPATAIIFSDFIFEHFKMLQWCSICSFSVVIHFVHFQNIANETKCNEIYIIEKCTSLPASMGFIELRQHSPTE